MTTTTRPAEIEIDPAKPGTYTVCETKAPTGYKLPADPCHENDVPANGTHTFVFADPPKVASTTLTPVQFLPDDRQLRGCRRHDHASRSGRRTRASRS